LGTLKYYTGNNYEIIAGCIPSFGLAVTDENGLFDAPRHEDLTLIVMIDRLAGLSLSRGERAL